MDPALWGARPAAHCRPLARPIAIGAEEERISESRASALAVISLEVFVSDLWASALFRQQEESWNAWVHEPEQAIE